MEIVAGLDEVGRGPLAGPVVAVAVVLHRPIPGLADSKVLSPAVREALCLVILEQAWVAVGAASVVEIDRINILQASLLAMRRAVARLPALPMRLMVDGTISPSLTIPTECIVGGDALVPSISAASIVAKVTRDRLMRRLALRHPGYGFERNVGYGTPEHLSGLERAGPTRHHRRSFAPIARLIAAL